MQFLNPLALMGLAAALIPLAIHLLHRGKPREVPFSNLAFLRTLHQSSRRSVRLRQWLVLLLRMLILICLALAFSRPALREGSGFLTGTQPTTAVLLVDHSYSTRYTPPKGRVFDRLRRQTEDILGLLDGSRDKVHIMPWPARAGAIVAGPVTAEAARQQLERNVPSEAAAGLNAALRDARALLQNEAGEQRELYLITDLARPDWAGISWEPVEDVSLFVVGPTESTQQNRFVGQIRIADWLAAPGQPLTIRTVVGRWGGPTAADETTVHLYIDGERVQQRRVSLPPDVPVPVEFSIAPRRHGRLLGFVEIEDDELAVDNRRYFTIDVPQHTAVVIAGPDARATYYPRRALSAAAAGDPTLSVTSLRLDELSAAHLAQADVLILANVQDPTSQEIRITREFAASGGGVLMIPGVGADAARLNRELLADLVPASLASISGRPGGAALVHLDTARLHSDLFAGLLDEPDDRPEFYATFGVQAQQQLAVLASFEDGQPALLEGRSRAGHVLLWPTPLDLAWSDVPLRGLFVPLLQRMVRYLSRTTSHSTDYIVGDRAWRRLAEADVDTRIEADAPSGRRLVVQAENVGDERLWKIPHLDEAGIWRLLKDGDVVDAFAVNVDVTEADLTPVTADDIRRHLGGNVHLLAEGASASEVVKTARFGRELWRELLVLAIGLLLLELWVGRAPAAVRANSN